MTRYRFRGIFLLFLMGHATACASWQVPVPTGSPVGESKSDRSLALADYIESEQPNKIRITLEDGSQIVLHAPEVEGDVVVSSVTSTVIAIADIVRLEVQVSPPPSKTTIPALVGLLGLGFWLLYDNAQQDAEQDAAEELWKAILGGALEGRAYIELTLEQLDVSIDQGHHRYVS
jgi:hypothetical protein